MAELDSMYAEINQNSKKIWTNHTDEIGTDMNTVHMDSTKYKEKIRELQIRELRLISNLIIMKEIEPQLRLSPVWKRLKTGSGWFFDNIKEYSLLAEPIQRDSTSIQNQFEIIIKKIEAFISYPPPGVRVEPDPNDLIKLLDEEDIIKMWECIEKNIDE